MTVSPRLFVLPFALAPLAACSESMLPSGTETPVDREIAKVEMTPAAAPSEVVEQTEPKPQSERVGQRDPHATLDPERLIQVALQHDDEGRSELVLKALADRMAKFPDAAQLYAVRASLRLQMQQVSAALQDLEKAVTLAPQDTGIRVNRAQAYRSFVRYD